MKRIIIVGAGVSGLHLAYTLMKKYEVHVFEKMDKETLLKAHPWTDSIDLETLPLIDLPVPVKKEGRFYGEYVKDRETRTGIYEPVKKSNAPRIAVDRNALITYLLNKISKRCIIHYGSEVIDLLGNTKGKVSDHNIKGITYKKNNEIKELYSDLVVDSSGVGFIRHKFESELGEKVNENDLFSAYKTMRKLSDINALNKYKNGELILNPKGYRWISLLDDDILDVGCAIVSEIKDKEAAKKEAELMISKMEGVEEFSFGGGGNIIPMTLPLSCLVTNGFVCIGESALTTNPGNGCGISNAILSAELLSNIIRKNDNFSIYGLWEYAYEWLSGKGAYYACNYFPSHLFSEEECKLLSELKLITGTLKNSSVTSFPDSLIHLHSANLYELNEDLYKKVKKLMKLTKDLYKVLLDYPEKYNEELYMVWEKQFRKIKNSYYNF